MKELKICTVEDLINTINGFNNHYIFRGQSCSDWKLQSGLERILNPNWSADKAKKAEDFSLSQFKSKFHLYSFSNSKPKTTFQWLSIMQHYGVPTRLLDFTESPYNALYFAIESYLISSEKDFAIYAIDYRSLLKASINYIQQENKSFKYTYENISNNQDSIFDKFINKFSYNILWIGEPEEINTRLDRQAGCFLMSGNPKMTIEDIISSEIYKEVNIRKIVISNKLYESVFALLKKTNTTSKVLYGDLMGLAMSIKMNLNVYLN